MYTVSLLLYVLPFSVSKRILLRIYMMHFRKPKKRQGSRARGKARVEEARLASSLLVIPITHFI